IMPFCSNGELFDHVADTGAMEEEMARHLFLQLLAGLEYLQQMGVCHRDMSLENLLLDSDLQCVIIDLGMCLRVSCAVFAQYFTQFFFWLNVFGWLNVLSCLVSPGSSRSRNERIHVDAPSRRLWQAKLHLA